MKVVQFFVQATILALPLYIVRCKSFSWCVSPIPFTFLELLIIITFAAWLIWRVLLVKHHKKGVCELSQGLRSTLYWPLVIFLVISTISVFLSPNFISAAGIWKAYFVEPFLLYIVVLDISIIKKSITWLVIPLLFSGLWVSLLAIWQVVTGTNQFAPYAIAQGRVSSIYSTPNAIGLYVGPLALLALGCLVELYRRKKISLKKFGLPLYLALWIATFILAIYFSKSRGAGFGISVSLLVFILIVFYRNSTGALQRMLRWGFLIAVVGYFILNIFIFVRLDSLVQTYKPSHKDSIASRLCIWQSTTNMLLEKPISGLGLAAYQKTYPAYATCESEAHLYPHNLLLNFWTETGFFGMVAFLWICFVSFKILGRSFKNFIPVGLFSALVYIFVHGLVDVPYFKNDLAVEFWLLLAIIVWVFDLRRGAAKDFS